MAATVTWLGHAALDIRTGAHRVLVDQFLNGNPQASLKPDEAEADFILVSHGHGDHVGDTVSIARRTGALVITNGEISRWLSEQDVKTHGQQLGGGYQHPFGYLKLTQATHSSELPDGSYGGSSVGFLLTTNDGDKIYMACDTGLFGDMQLMGDEGIDLAVLPIGEKYTMGPSDAVLAVKLFRPKHVIPIHYATFEVIAQDPHAWAKQVQEETDTRVHVLDPGGSFEL